MLFVLRVDGERLRSPRDGFSSLSLFSVHHLGGAPLCGLPIFSFLTTSAPLWSGTWNGFHSFVGSGYAARRADA